MNETTDPREAFVRSGCLTLAYLIGRVELEDLELAVLDVLTVCEERAGMREEWN